MVYYYHKGVWNMNAMKEVNAESKRMQTIEYGLVILTLLIILIIVLIVFAY